MEVEIKFEDGMAGVEGVMQVSTVEMRAEAGSWINKVCIYDMLQAAGGEVCHYSTQIRPDGVILELETRIPGSRAHGII